MTIPKIPIGAWLNGLLETATDLLSDTTLVISDSVERAIDTIEACLTWPPAQVFVLLLALLSFWAVREVAFSLLAALAFLLIRNLGLWNEAMSTLALVVCATLITMVFGIPLGIVAGLKRDVEKVVMPVLDVMQTMPSMVYLIPAIPFFRIGKVSALFATVVFAMPPIIRMSCLGLKQVPKDLLETSDAFGASRMQRLFKLQLPLAMPTMLAGVNQAVLLALSMVVIAAMIGARGLGGAVWQAIQRLNLALGFEAGISIVIIAIFLDRLLNKMGRRLTKGVQ
jgi:glycine betaine/proline transport system permease protein